jgi:hypothetical protein
LKGQLKRLERAVSLSTINVKQEQCSIQEL